MSLYYERQPTWHFNPGGSNRDTGLDALHPLRDQEEIHRRLGKGTWTLRQPTTITITGASSATDPLYMPQVMLAEGAQLTIQGATATVLATGTITSFVAFNAGAQTLDTITVAWTTGGSSFAPYERKLMRITGGARAGTAWIINDDLGSSTATISNPGTVSALASPQQAGYGFTRVVPVATDPFEIVSLPSCAAGIFRIESAKKQAASTVLGSVTMSGLGIAWADDVALNYYRSGGIASESVHFNLLRCEIAGLTSAAPTLRGVQNVFTRGRKVAGGSIFDANLQTRGTGSASPHFIGLGPGISILQSGELFDDAYIIVAQGAVGWITSARFFNGSNGVTAQAGGVLHFGSDVWGTNNAGNGIEVQSLGRAEYTLGAPPTINAGLGPGREVRLGDRNVLYADLPLTSRGATMELFAV
jgi:hypothetical protein